jgi:hypothetical protein
VGVLLADLLERDERLGCDPRVARGEELVELGDAEGIDANRRKVGMLVLAGTAGLARNRAG